MSSAINQGQLGGLFQVIMFASNAVITLHGTVFIIFRLLVLRRMAIACLGNKAPTARCLCLVGILLESAAINVPIAIGAAIGDIFSINPMSILIPVLFPSQVRHL